MTLDSKPKNTRGLTPAESAQVRQILRYGVWIFGAIIVALIVASVLSSVFNLEGGAGKATSIDPQGTLVVTQAPN